MKQNIFFIGTLFLLLLVFTNYTKEEIWPEATGIDTGYFCSGNCFNKEISGIQFLIFAECERILFYQRDVS